MTNHNSGTLLMSLYMAIYTFSSSLNVNIKENKKTSLWLALVLLIYRLYDIKIWFRIGLMLMNCMKQPGSLTSTTS